MNMHVPQNSLQIQVFHGMTQFYICVIKNFVVIKAPIIKVIRKVKNNLSTKECQKTWEFIKQKYIKTSILIPPKWDMEFHVHTNASLLAMGVLLT
jgi:hypothetical protein